MKPVSFSPYAIALAFRLSNASISRSFFQPDEYWQSLEVAHLWVFGYGFKTWEWRTSGTAVLKEAGKWKEWRNLLVDGGKGGIRSPLSVLPTAVLYQILKLAGLDERGEWLVLAPRLLQACIAASADVATRKLAERVLGEEYGNAALLVTLTSFFSFFTSTRTFSNSTETALTIWALHLWPWESYRDRMRLRKDAEHEKKSLSNERLGSLQLALVFAATATIIRPSNAIIWLILGSRLFLRSSNRQKVSIMASASVVSSSAIAVSLALDTSFYQTPTFTPLRFLSTNIFHSISLFYGQNPWHFYLFQGIPLLLLTQLPFFLDGVRKSYRSGPRDSPIKNRMALRELGWTATGAIASYSLLSHKEWRFLYPILPILHLFVTLSLVSAYRSFVPPPRTSSSSSFTQKLLHPLERLAIRSRIRLSHLILLLASLVPATYLTAFHQRGQDDVMLWLRDEFRSQRTSSSGAKEVKSVGFAMPCHSTPWQSHLHSKDLEEEGRSWFITCEPPISGQPQDIYLDQSDHFYLTPSTYFLTRFPPAVDPTFPPSVINSSPNPFSSSSSISIESAPSHEAQRKLIANRFDRKWTYSAWPSHLVVFQALLDTPCRGEESCENVGDLLVNELGYETEKKFWNGLRGWHEDERRKGGVVVLSWRGLSRITGEVQNSGGGGS